MDSSPSTSIPMIRRVEIENYRSIDKVVVDLSPVTVLIGKSGSGKSNFCYALRFLRNLVTDTRSAIAEEGGIQQIFPVWKDFQQRQFKISVNFTIGKNEDYKYTIRLEAKKEKYYVIEETLIFRDKSVFTRDITKWLYPPRLANPPKLEQDSLCISQLSALSEAVYAYSALSSGLAYHNFQSQVLTDRRQNSNPTIPESGLGRDASRFREILAALTRDINMRSSKDRILQCLRQINSSIQSIEPDNVLKPERISVAHKAGNMIIDLDLANESDGLRRFYAHLLALYQTPSKMALIFEEPENAIYPAALQILANEFKMAAQEGRGQVILTTHNPNLLDYFDADFIRLVETKGLATKIGPLDPAQIEALKAQDLYPGELLTVDPARMAQEG
ncbi:MAG: AAA family ATPase [Candidatus Sumerlaeota bacterium]|nr:AAA family ATPase [Candidatus Sumerlaeota bacterium]